MSRNILGTRIRERRRALGLTQAALARRIGISASYLNLIERNKRRVSGDLLAAVAAELGLKAGELDGAAERRLHDELTAIARDPRLEELGIEADQAGELIGRYPGWARAVGALARVERDQAALAQAFADRLTHDPYLGEAVHRMLTRIAAIRSTSEILETVTDIDPAQAGRFHAILSEEARALSDVGEALASYFDRASTDAREVTPVDEVETFFLQNENRFPAIDAALAGAEPPRSETARQGLAEMRAGPVVDRLIGEAPGLSTSRARARARAALLEYARDAIALPMARFAPLAAAQAYDLDALIAETGASPDIVCRRLTALPRGKECPRIGYVAANAAGALTALREIPGFHPIRHGTVCPLWTLCRAQQTPERALRQLASLPTGQLFLFVARAAPTGPPGFGRALNHRTDMIVIDAGEADLTVYGAERSGEMPVEEVGPSCRVCPRKGCAHRVDDPLAA